MSNDDRVLARKTELINYINFLERQKQVLIDNANGLRSLLINLDWNDAVFDNTVAVSNKHFETMNVLLSGISDAIYNMNKFLNELDGYFNSVRNLN